MQAAGSLFGTLVQMGGGESIEAIRRVRVGLVDDSGSIRSLLRLSFDLDDRFEVIGEAENGQQAIGLVERTMPDLLVLDREMPVLGGVEAIPQIRLVSPRTAIIMYTAGADAGAYQAALAAGAVEVLDKAGVQADLVDRIAQVLVDHWAEPGADVEVRVGPVSAAAARVWITNTRKIISAVRAHRDEFDPAVPADVLDLFDRFLDLWWSVAEESEDFRWVARAAVEDMQRVVEHWAAIDRMTDADLMRLGISWSPPEGEPFFHALTAGVLQALVTRDETQQLAAALRTQWAQDEPA